MGAYTLFHFVSAGDPGWTPNRGFVTALLEYVDATGVWCLQGYSRSLYWDDPAVLLNPEFVCEDLSLMEAVDKWETGGAKVTAMHLTSGVWVDALYNSLLDLPESLTDEYQPVDMSLRIGPSSLPDRWMRSTAGCYNFVFTLSGHGSPNDSLRYLQCFGENVVIKELLAFLHDRSGQDWGILMSTS